MAELSTHTHEKKTVHSRGLMFTSSKRQIWGSYGKGWGHPVKKRSNKIPWIWSNPITFSANSNKWQESFLEVIRQNIVEWCQQTFCFQKFVDNAQQVLPLRLKQTFHPIIWIFTEGKGDRNESRLPFKIFSALRANQNKRQILWGENRNL